jgi:hypothetical protein
MKNASKAITKRTLIMAGASAALNACAPDQVEFVRAVVRDNPDSQKEKYNVAVQTNPRMGQTLACIENPPGACWQMFAFEGSARAIVGIVINALIAGSSIATAVGVLREAAALSKSASQSGSGSGSGSGSSAGAASESNATGGNADTNVSVSSAPISIENVISSVNSNSNRNNLTAQQRSDLTATLSQMQNQQQHQQQHQQGPKVNVDVQAPQMPHGGGNKYPSQGGGNEYPSQGGGYNFSPSTMNYASPSTLVAQSADRKEAVTISLGSDLVRVDEKRYASFSYAGSGQVIVAEQGKAPQILDTRTARRDPAIRQAYDVGTSPIRMALSRVLAFN